MYVRMKKITFFLLFMPDISHTQTFCILLSTSKYDSRSCVDIYIRSYKLPNVTNKMFRFFP